MFGTCTPAIGERERERVSERGKQRDSGGGGGGGGMGLVGGGWVGGGEGMHLGCPSRHFRADGGKDVLRRHFVRVCQRGQERRLACFCVSDCLVGGLNSHFTKKPFSILQKQREEVEGGGGGEGVAAAQPCQI